MKKPILVPTDLTTVAIKAVDQAIVLAEKAGTGISLLHVMNERSPSKAEVMIWMNREAARIREKTGKECEILIGEGSIFDVIPQIVCEHEYELMVIGTHGIHGLKQLFFGSNILKLVMKVCVPALVVQEESPLVNNFEKLVMPVSSHLHFKDEINNVMLLAELFNAEVHLYSINKPGFPWPEQLIINIAKAEAAFAEKGLRLKRVKEEQQSYSPGYAKQTIRYAGSVNADVISVITASTEDYHYFAQTDKETLLLNELRIPVLCTA